MSARVFSWLNAGSSLVAWPRSRLRPQRRKLRPLNMVRLFLDEHLLWHLCAPHSNEAENQRIAAIRVAEAALHNLTLDQVLARLSEINISPSEVLGEKGIALHAAVLAVMRHRIGFGLRDNQVACARALLAGRCVELRTGEGKTYAAGLAALLAARVGVSSHVITVNEYLAARDHDYIAPLAQDLGLTSAVVMQEMDDAAWLAAYDCDIVYGANKTFVFDHLRDMRELRTHPGKPGRQTGQILAIIDEADSVLVDDATTPMLLSEPTGDIVPEDLKLFHDLTAFADGCAVGREVSVDRYGGHRLTPQGIKYLEQVAAQWYHPIARSHDLLDLAEKSLAAKYSFREGEAWVRQEDGIAMIDQSTGRLMPDRKWDYGLQQLVEIRAELPPGSENRTVGQITQQSFFRQYSALGGLTGTAKECRAEFWAIYQLAVEPIAPHAPSRLLDLGLTVEHTAEAKWRKVFARSRQLAAEGRAVLIGLNDVLEAEALAHFFADSGLDYAVLDAMSEAEEAELIAIAGRPGRITIATHLAGRGTDISLTSEVLERGGLHVIIGSTMASARLVRQLCGRAGRKGQPGSYEQIIARTDRMLSEGQKGLKRWLWTQALTLPNCAAFALGQIQADRDSKARASRRASLLREQKLIQQLGYR